MSPHLQTLNDYVDLLKTNQQEYIVWCIQQYTERKHFHRGLLPFITTHEVARCLKAHLEVLKIKAIELDFINNQKVPLVGHRFISTILSIIEAELLKKLCEEDATTVMFLKSVKIAKMVGRKFDTEICIRLVNLYGASITTVDGFVELKLVGKDKWKITCHKKVFDIVTTWLAEKFR